MLYTKIYFKLPKNTTALEETKNNNSLEGLGKERIYSILGFLLFTDALNRSIMRHFN